jgi:lipopolysaccharide transport system permease protein
MPPKPVLKIVPPAASAPTPSPVTSAPVAAAPRKRLHSVIFGVESGIQLVDLKDTWEYRELAMLLAWRDIKLRYAQTVLGFGWTILQPLFSTGIFTILFGKLAKVPSDGVPYPVFNYLGMLPWLFFVNAVNRSSSCLVSNSYVLTKVYFPRLLLPIGSLLPGFVDLAVGLTSVVPLMFYFGVTPSLSALFWVPVLTMLAAMQALGISVFLSALNVRFRDTGNLIPFVLQMGMWITPITYPISLVPERYRMWLTLNPTLGFIDGYRNAFLGRPIDMSYLAVSVVWTVVVVLVGLYYFRRVESTFADIV